MVYEGFLTNIANLLGLPLNAKRRKADGTDVNSTTGDQYMNDFINVIVDITADDVVIGDNAFIYTCHKRIGNNLRAKVESLRNELNHIALWTAKDLLKLGYSAYSTDIIDGQIYFNPILTPLSFFLLKDKTIQVVSTEQNIEIKNALLFLYYEKDMLKEIKVQGKDGKELTKLQINPVGIQLKNIGRIAKDLALIEKAIERFRVQSSRIVRFGTVDVGQNSGDKQQDILDDISEGINAESIDMITDTTFTDQIPIFPTRKEIGKLEMVEQVPAQPNGDFQDLDYYLSKFFMALRFPKSYADFSQALSESATSMIRGDLRYAKLISSVRSIINKAVNKWVAGIDSLSKINLRFELSKIPNSETDEVIETVNGFVDATSSAYDLLTTASTYAEAYYLLQSLRGMLSTSTNIGAINTWLDNLDVAVKRKFEKDAIDEAKQEAMKESGDQGEPLDETLSSLDDLASGGEDLGGEDLGGEEAGGEEAGTEGGTGEPTEFGSFFE